MPTLVEYMDINSTKEVAGGFLNTVYNSVFDCVPVKYHTFVILGFYVILIAIYAIFIWKFYRFLARRDIIKLDLREYNTSSHPKLRKFVAVLFFLLKYIIILPFLVLFWFAILALFLLLLAKNQELGNVILVSAAIIGATRISAYVSEDLSKDLAKMLPFTLLGIFLIDPSFFSVSDFILRLHEIPKLLQSIWMYLIFILVLEIILRGLFIVIDLFRSNSEENLIV